MVTKEVFKKTFWPVFIIIFIIVAVFVGEAVYSSIYESQVKKTLSEKGFDTKNLSHEEIEQLTNTKDQNIEIGDDVFTCENDNSVQSRGYIYLHGLGDHNQKAFDYQRRLIENDSKTKDILDFDYDELQTLKEISDNFSTKFNEFVLENDLEEIIIIGQSAGGVVVSFSAHRLDFDGIIELHTLASPLNGYHVSEQFLGELVGFSREIGEGFEPFKTPPNNVKVYHHKTVEDESLRSWCGDYADFCDPLKVQYNNIEGSKEFFYPEQDHTSIMFTVSKLIIDCHR